MSTDARRLAFALTAASRRLQRWIDSQSGGVRASGAGVLFYLTSHRNALIGDVAKALHAKPSSMSGLIDRLGAAGLVARMPDDDDGRVIRLKLTDAGTAAIPKALQVVSELNGRLQDGFTDQELDVVARWLRHVEKVCAD